MSECAFGFLDEVFEFAWGVAEELGLAVDVGGGRFQAGFLDEFVHEAEVEGHEGREHLGGLAFPFVHVAVAGVAHRFA